MNLKQYLFFLTTGTVVSWFAFFTIITNIDPVTAGALAFFVLYASLFFGLLGLISTIATFIRAVRLPKQPVELIMKTSLRQGLILSILVETALILSSRDALTWWMLIILLGGVGILEFVFISFAKEN